MRLNLEKLKSYSSLELCDLLTPIFEKIKEGYQFVEIDEKTYKKIMLFSIEETIKNIDDTKIETFDLQLAQKAKKYIKKYIRKQLSDPIIFTLILNKFILEKIKDKNNYKNSLNELKKISAFFNEVEFIPTTDLYIELLKNPVIENMTKIIVQVNLNVITSNNIDNIFKDDYLISIIETYCMINDIKIKEKEDDFYDNFNEDSRESFESEYTSDIVKTYLKEINKPVLSESEEKELAYRILQGDERARKIFIERNLKLVVSIAKRYVGRELQFMDLIQEGNIGLMTAVDKFDVTRGYKFSTYATQWIRQAITGAIADKGRNVRVPVRLYEKIGKFRRTQSTLQKKLNREPSIEEIAKEMNISIAEATKLHKLQSDTVSINSLVDYKEDTELENFIPTELENFIPAADQTPEDEVVDSTLQINVRELLQKCNLKEREIEILMLRYGFNDQQSMTLKEVGKRFNVTWERIRQIEAKAIMKIRKSKYIKEFAIYMNSPTEAMENIETYREFYRDDRNRNKKFDNTKVSKNQQILPKETTSLPKQKTSKPIQQESVIENIKQESQQLEKSKVIKERNNIKMKGKKLQTIYEYLKGYTREETDVMLSKLSDEEMSLVRLRYGEDLDNPVASSTWGKEQNNKFYGCLIPKMKRLLSNPDGTRKKYTRRPKVETDSKFSEGQQLANIVSNPEIKEKESVTPQLITPEEQQKEALQPPTSEIEKEDCVRILELMRTPSFGEMLKTLTPKEAVIICLKLGYVDGKCFTTESVAGFLGIENEEVIETTKKVLLLYKENINQFIDKAVEVVIDPSLVLKKKEN